MGLDEINKASLRWQHTKDGKAVYQPSATGSLTSKNIIHDKEIRKSRFEIIRDTVSDLREGHLIAKGLALTAYIRDGVVVKLETVE